MKRINVPVVLVVHALAIGATACGGPMEPGPDAAADGMCAARTGPSMPTCDPDCDRDSRDDAGVVLYCCYDTDPSFPHLEYPDGARAGTC